MGIVPIPPEGTGFSLFFFQNAEWLICLWYDLPLFRPLSCWTLFQLPFLGLNKNQ